MSSGFVAGTLMHTDKGLIPIQNLKVGDLVWSKDKKDFNSDSLLKPILNIITYPENEIYGMNFSIAVERSKNEKFAFVYDMDEEALEEKRKLETSYLESDFILLGKRQNFLLKQAEFSSKSVSETIIQNSLHTINDDFLPIDIKGNLYFVEHFQPVIKTAYCEKVYYELFKDNSEGLFIDIQNYQKSKFQYPSLDEIYSTDDYNNILVANLDDNGSFVGEKPYFHDTFALEIADFNNYFVGKKGLWVGDSTIQGTTE